MIDINNITPSIDVLKKQDSIVRSLMGPDSVYIRTHEKLDEMLANDQISDVQKSEMYIQIMSNLNSSMISSSLSTSLQWEEFEKKTEIDLAVASSRLALEAQDLLNKQKELDRIKAQIDQSQAEVIRMYGGISQRDVDGNVVALNDAGKIYEDILNAQQQRDNLVQDLEILKVREKEGNANVHRIIADTYNNHGSFTYTIADNGLTSITDTTPVGKTTQNSIQEVIAKQQANGYSYNSYGNAASGLSATIGVGLTSNLDIFTGNTIVQDWGTTIDKLKDIPIPYTITPGQ